MRKRRQRRQPTVDELIHLMQEYTFAHLDYFEEVFRQATNEIKRACWDEHTQAKHSQYHDRIEALEEHIRDLREEALRPLQLLLEKLGLPERHERAEWDPEAEIAQLSPEYQEKARAYMRWGDERSGRFRTALDVMKAEVDEEVAAAFGDE
jgi:hypothetical protein